MEQNENAVTVQTENVPSTITEELKAGEVFCRQCRAIIKKQAEICPKCGVRQRSENAVIVQTENVPNTKTEEVFCRQCGATIKKQAEICPKCGVRQRSEKNPGIAAAASFLFVGLGQIYNGQIGKGILFIVIQLINVALMFVVIGFITAPLFWIYGIYDAYNTAKTLNMGD